MAGCTIRSANNKVYAHRETNDRHMCVINLTCKIKIYMIILAYKRLNCEIIANEIFDYILLNI